MVERAHLGAMMLRNYEPRCIRNRGNYSWRAKRRVARWVQYSVSGREVRLLKTPVISGACCYSDSEADWKCAVMVWFRQNNFDAFEGM